MSRVLWLAVSSLYIAPWRFISPWPFDSRMTSRLDPRKYIAKKVVGSTVDAFIPYTVQIVSGVFLACDSASVALITVRFRMYRRH